MDRDNNVVMDRFHQTRKKSEHIKQFYNKTIPGKSNFKLEEYNACKTFTEKQAYLHRKDIIIRFQPSGIFGSRNRQRKMTDAFQVSKNFPKKFRLYSAFLLKKDQ